MSAIASQVQAVAFFIGGRWQKPPVTGYSPVYNPSTVAVIARTPLAAAPEVDRAVEASSAAFKSWADSPPPRRTGVLFRYRELLNGHVEELARLVTRENGKTLEE